MRKPFVLLTIGTAVVVAVVLLALSLQEGRDKAAADDLKVELDFIIVGNEGDDLETTWTEAQIKSLINGANNIYAQNGTGIIFNWPKQGDADPFKQIDDPQKSVGDPGDVKIPPLSPQLPYLGDDLAAAGLAEPAGEWFDPKLPPEAYVVCNNALANGNAGQLPVALVQHFVDSDGTKTSLLGVAYTNGTKDPGFCILLSGQVKGNAQTLAHELGHVLCLAHVGDPNNLMSPFKLGDSSNTILTPQQIDQLCPKLIMPKLVPQPTKIASPTPSPEPSPTPTPFKTGSANVTLTDAPQFWDVVPKDQGFAFLRVVIEIGTPDQEFKVASAVFRCHAGDETVDGVFKERQKDVNPTPDPLPHHEVWSGTFSTKCDSPVLVTLRPVDPHNKLLIKAAHVENGLAQSPANVAFAEHGPFEFKVTSKATFAADRVEIDVGTDSQVQKVSAVLFTCQSSGEEVGVLAPKRLDKNANPSDPLPHHEVWGATFSTKCIAPGGGVTAVVYAFDMLNQIVVKSARVQNSNLPPNTPTPAITQTPTITSTPTITPTPTKQPDPGDTDGDGCPDVDENGADEKLGGQRDYTNPWDYFNPTNDGRNRIDDVLAVIDHYRIDQGDDGYDPKYDRTLEGPNAWDLGPPDGKMRIDDVLNIISQYRHNCGTGIVKPTPTATP